MAIQTPHWVVVKHDDLCKCGAMLNGGEDRAVYSMDDQAFIECEKCSADYQSANAAEIEAATPIIPPAVITAATGVNAIASLVLAVESFARANGCADKVDSMLAAILRAATK